MVGSLDGWHDTWHHRDMTTTAIHSLCADLRHVITVELMENGEVTIYGPAGTANRVVNAIEAAGRTLGENVTWTRTRHGWFAAVTV